VMRFTRRLYQNGYTTGCGRYAALLRGYAPHFRLFLKSRAAL